MKPKGILFVLAGPSGVGKSTIRARLVNDLGLVYSISATTREPRAGEQKSGDYEFISTEEFQRRIDSHEFIEWARVFGRGYGTPKEPLMADLSRGKDVLLEIDVQGVDQIRRQQPSLNSNVYYIFVLPPSLDELKRRQHARGSDALEEIEKRLQESISEISRAHEFDLIVINRELDHAVRVISGFIRAAREC